MYKTSRWRHFRRLRHSSGQVHWCASVGQVAGGRRLHPDNVAESQTVQHVKGERLELEGQVHTQENSNPTTTSQQMILLEYSLNKLWCDSTTNPVPVLCIAIAALRGFSELTKIVTRSSHGHSTPCHLPWKFHANRSSRFLVILLTKKQRKKETKKLIENNTLSPVPWWGDGLCQNLLLSISV